MARAQGEAASRRAPAVALDEVPEARVGDVVRVPGPGFRFARARAVVAVLRQLRRPQPGEQAFLLGDAVEHLDRRVHDHVAAVDDALEDDLQHLAGRDAGVEGGAHRVLQRLMAPRHRVLSRQHQQPRAQVERRPAGNALHGEIEPELREMLVERVALRDAPFERLRLQLQPGVEGGGAVLGAKVGLGHGFSVGYPGSCRRSAIIVLPMGSRITMSAMSSSGVSWLLMITRLAPDCLASRGNDAAGSTTSDEPMAT